MRRRSRRSRWDTFCALLVLLTILLIDVVLSVIARTMPQVNIFIVSLPLKIFVGLLVLAISLRHLGPLTGKIFESIFEYWHRLLS